MLPISLCNYLRIRFSLYGLSSALDLQLLPSQSFILVQSDKLILAKNICGKNLKRNHTDSGNSLHYFSVKKANSRHMYFNEGKEEYWDG